MALTTILQNFAKIDAFLMIPLIAATKINEASQVPCGTTQVVESLFDNTF